jgi:hypothetical protein
LFLSVALAFHQSILLPTYITGYSHYNWYRFRGEGQTEQGTQEAKEH